MQKLAVLVVFGMLAVTVAAQVPTTLDDFFMPGSQPNESGTIQTSGNCNCHGGYDTPVEPEFNWQGSMMSQAARDPLFYASMTIAEQDAPASGDLCIRCHSPKAWLEGRSTPTDGSAITQDDRESVTCHFCHKAIKPSDVGVNPYPGDADYTATTYNADQTYLSGMTAIPDSSANGMFIIDDVDIRRGPYTDPSAPHDFYYSPFHKESDICGTCHDVSNPAFTDDGTGNYVPNAFGTPAPDFDPFTMFPIERTYSEWRVSDYNTAAGVYAPQFGGNLDTVRSCQDCHMRDTTGQGCKKGSAPVRDDLAIHDMTGGNTFIPQLIDDAFPNDPFNQEALDSGIVRARRMLQMAASMNLSAGVNGSQHDLDVQIINETGHKLPSGYPEGRRAWINVKAYSATDQLVYESGAYDTATAVLTEDSDTKIYEIKPGISQSLSPTVGIPAGPSFHFVLNDTIYSDNRIPARGFTNANYDLIGSPVVDYSYPDGQYWDNTQYLVPGSAARIEVTLYYQTTSKEFVTFLRDENTTNHWGDSLYSWWEQHGKSTPEVMVADTINVTPLTTNAPPQLASINDTTIDETQLLELTVSATDPDGDPITLTHSTLPSGASFTDNGNGTGDFAWTPTFDQSGSYPIEFYATDTVGASDTEAVTITVNNVNRAPLIASIAPQTVDENVQLAFEVIATDPDGTMPTLSAFALPTDAGFADSGDGTGGFYWTPTYDQAGSYAVSFVASDGSLADTQVVSITVNNVNRAPQLASISNQTYTAGEAVSIEATASDPDGTTPTMTSPTHPSTASFVDHGDGTATLSWNPDNSDVGVHPVTIVATDGDLADTVEFTIEITSSPSCCIDPSGDMNGDGNNADPVDLSYLVDFLFAGGTAPPCDEEADINGDGTVADPVDLSYFVDFLFAGGPGPQPCLTPTVSPQQAGDAARF